MRNFFRNMAFRWFSGGSNGGGASNELVCTSDAPTPTTVLNDIVGLKIFFPNASIVYDNIFSYCRSLVSVDLPNATIIYSAAFYGCESLTDVNLPMVRELRDAAFSMCTALTTIDLPECKNIRSSVFCDCTSLHTIILRKHFVCEIDIHALINTKIVTAGCMPTGEGFIYVPASCYEDYIAMLTEQAAVIAGDADVAEQLVRMIFRKIEDYPEICG